MTSQEVKNKFKLEVGDLFALRKNHHSLWGLCKNSSNELEVFCFTGRISNRKAENFFSNITITDIVHYAVTKAEVGVGIIERNHLATKVDGKIIPSKEYSPPDVTINTLLYVIQRGERT